MNNRLLNWSFAFFCSMTLLFSASAQAQAPCPLNVKDFAPIDGKDCVYFLELTDTGANGWDGASVDVAVSGAAPVNYKMTVADGACVIYPIYVNDGETIELAYWNGAFEMEHGLSVYDATGALATDENGDPVTFTGNIPANTPYLVKADCPINSCKDQSETFTVRITMGLFPEEQSWEIYEGLASASSQGAQVIGVNANTYAGLSPGFQAEYAVELDLCQTYTFVAFDGFNDGWDVGAFEILSSNADYGTQITDPNDPQAGASLVLAGTGFVDETRTEFTLPCSPVCEDVVLTGAIDCEITNPELPFGAAEVCYPNCGHALGCDITVDQYVLPYGDVNAAIYVGSEMTTGSGTMLFSGTLPSGAHGLVTKYTYCDGIMVKCTSDLIISGGTNSTLTCNDNVQISLGAPEWDDDDNQNGNFLDDLNECVVAVTPDMVLEMPELCEGEYDVIIQDANGSPMVTMSGNGLPLDRFGNEIAAGSTASPAHNLVGAEAVGQTLTYTVVHRATGNTCWGTITVEDKIAPIIDCKDYEVSCTNPNVLDERYRHEEEFVAAAELPANVAGGTNGLESNTWVPVNIPCGALGENVKNAHLHISFDHNELTDLQIIVHPPVGLYGFLNPIMVADNGDVEEENEFSLNALMQYRDCSRIQSTSPEFFVTENSGAATPSNLGGTWYVQIIDNDAEFVDNPFGGGQVTEVEIHLECGFPSPSTGYDCSYAGIELLSETIAGGSCDAGTQIVRVWQAADAFGNTSTCTQTVTLVAPTMTELVKPTDVTLECNGQTPEELTIEETGSPSLGCYQMTEESMSYCDFSYMYEDTVIPTCGEGFKIIREWTLMNWCTGQTEEFTQIIKVEDTEGPAISQGDITVSTSTYDCSANVSLSDLNIEDTCSGISAVTASYTQNGGAYQSNGGIVIVDLTSDGILEGLPVGANEVLISATDGCLNESQTMITITVVDDSAPVAICDDELHVSLGGDGTARLKAEDIDEGSYDNCSEITLEVRRTDGCLGTTEWSSYVPFECCDVNSEVTVELRVTDALGNANVCWKSVLVEDALPPAITCPADKTFNCDDVNIHDAFGEAAAIDNCNVSVTYVDEEDFDNCHAGTLTRTFTATDGSDKSTDATCTQTITVVHVSDFVVQFPDDVELENCQLEDTPAPQVSDDDCELVAVSYSDKVFDIVPDACYKIERTWTVVNWCNYDPQAADNTDLGYPQPLPRTYQDDGDGYFEYVQIIKVIDNEAPVIDCIEDVTFCDLTDGCEGAADLVLGAEDACSTDFGSLVISYQIDAFNDGTFDIVNSGNDASGMYPYGTHLIKWTVEDGCGNFSVCEHLFTIQDCKNPTPVCLNGLSIPTMNSNGCVEIWASDLLEYAFDNCSDEDFVEASAKMRRAGTQDILTTGLTFCCDELGTNIVEIWVEDEAGNADFCETYIIVQDNNSACNTDQSRATIAGVIRTQDAETVADVEVELEGTTTLQTQMTDNNGAFAFNDLDLNTDYTVSPQKDIEPLNGVSTFDLVLMSQHILGLGSLTSPYSMIAADVNNDGNITTFDIVQTRQLILYVITDFPSNNSWRFVDADYVFPNANNPWESTFPELISFANLTQNELNTDFVGIKIGDVDGNAIANNLLGSEERTANGNLVFNIDDASFDANETVKVEFRASDFNDINGFQFTLNFDANAMTFNGVESGAIAVSDANFGTTMLNEGVLTTSWNNANLTKVANDEVLFTVNFKATATATLSQAIGINSRYTNAEAYQANDLLDVALAFNTTEGTLVAEEKFELYQNTPNPFNDNTIIGFNLPTASEATLRIFDVTGKTLKVVNGEYAKGYNQVTLSKNDLNISGILYYELINGTKSDIKKMIIIQ